MFAECNVPLFSLGRLLLITDDAQQLLDDTAIARAILAHSRGDWGILNRDDWCINDEALDNGAGILSMHVDVHDNRFYIITEADRSTTTILLPDEY